LNCSIFAVGRPPSHHFLCIPIFPIFKFHCFVKHTSHCENTFIAWLIDFSTHFDSVPVTTATSIHPAEHIHRHLIRSEIINILLLLKNCRIFSCSLSFISLKNIRLGSDRLSLLDLTWPVYSFNKEDISCGISQSSIYFSTHLLSIWLNHWGLLTSFIEIFSAAITSLRNTVICTCTSVLYPCSLIQPFLSKNIYLPLIKSGDYIIFILESSFRCFGSSCYQIGWGHKKKYEKVSWIQYEQ
jgi:hypothetical protein